MAGQVVADLCWAIRGTWEDRGSWAAMGPGSKRGINRLLGNNIKQPVSQKEFTKHLSKMMRNGRKVLSRKLTNRLDAIDWQNCLCEFDKYERTLLEGKRPKRNYNGRNS